MPSMPRTIDVLHHPERLEAAVAAARDAHPRPPRWFFASDDTRRRHAIVISSDYLHLYVLYERAQTMEFYLCPLANWGRQTRAGAAPTLTHWDKRPTAGSAWRRFDGTRCRVVANATHNETGKHFVVFRDESRNVTWITKIEDWLSHAEDGQRQFVEIR